MSNARSYRALEKNRENASFRGRPGELEILIFLPQAIFYKLKFFRLRKCLNRQFSWLEKRPKEKSRTDPNEEIEKSDWKIKKGKKKKKFLRR